MQNTQIIYIIPLLLILFLLIYYVKTANKLRRYQVVIDESKKNIDIALTKRYDTISKMIKVAKSYAKYEKELFADITKSRRTSSISEFNKSLEDQNQAIDKIYALAEAYPELRSSDQFLRLQNEIDDENEQLAAAKRIVNNNISKINQIIVSFPSSVVAGMKGITKEEFLIEENVSRKSSIEDFDYEIL